MMIPALTKQQDPFLPSDVGPELLKMITEGPQPSPTALIALATAMGSKDKIQYLTVQSNLHTLRVATLVMRDALNTETRFKDPKDYRLPDHFQKCENELRTFELTVQPFVKMKNSLPPLL